MISTLSFDENRSYTNLVRQSRVMGVQFDSSVMDKILVVGDGDGERGENDRTFTTLAAINGMTAPGVMVVARDVDDEGEGVLLYLSHALQDEMEISDDGWWFTQAGDAYAAIRIANDSVEDEPHSVGEGDYHRLTDPWSPIVVQMGRASDYEGLSHFKQSVRDNRFTYAGSRLLYVSEEGDRIEYFAESPARPRINGEPLDLNPPMTYSTPYLTMTHGHDTATVRHPGHDELVLRFDYWNW